MSPEIGDWNHASKDPIVGALLKAYFHPKIDLNLVKHGFLAYIPDEKVEKILLLDGEVSDGKLQAARKQKSPWYLVKGYEDMGKRLAEQDRISAQHEGERLRGRKGVHIRK